MVWLRVHWPSWRCLRWFSVSPRGGWFGWEVDGLVEGSLIFMKVSPMILRFFLGWMVWLRGGWFGWEVDGLVEGSLTFMKVSPMIFRISSGWMVWLRGGWFGWGFTHLHEGVSDDFTFLLRVDGLVERPGLHLVGHGVGRVGGNPRVRRVERVRRVHSWNEPKPRVSIKSTKYQQRRIMSVSAFGFLSLWVATYGFIYTERNKHP